VTDATGMLAPIAALVMISTGRPTIDTPISLKTLFGIEDTNTVGAGTLHQVNSHILGFLLTDAHCSLLL